MKIAVVCDWLVTLGGAEKVLAAILDCFPHADLFAVVDFLTPYERECLHNKIAQTTFIQTLPFAKKYYRNYLPLMPLAIEQLDLSRYDMIISSSHAVAKGVITGPHQVHISYVHSPMRYAWDLQHQYLHESGLDKKWRGIIARYCLHKLREWDVCSANRVDHFIANSQFIAKRIDKTYRRESVIIYPPVDTDHFSPLDKKENFYLTASRFVPYKRIDLIVEAFQFLPDRELIVIGEGPDFEKIKRKAGKNVSLLGFLPNHELKYYMQRAKAFLFASLEDFGIAPLEAQACGTPVIAYGKGGSLETVRSLEDDKPTGIFFDAQTTAAIINGINRFEINSHRITIDNCVRQAALFSTHRFRNELKQFVTSVLNKK